MLSEAFVIASGHEAPELDPQLPPEADAVPLTPAAPAADVAAVDPRQTTTSVLAERESNLEQRLAERETEIVALTRQVDRLRRQNQQRRREEERLVARLARRSAQLERTLEQQGMDQRRIEALEAQVEAQRARQKALEAEIGELRARLASARQSGKPRVDAAKGFAANEARKRAAAGAPPRGSPSVANLMAWWQDMRPRIAAYAARFVRLVLSRLPGGTQRTNRQ